MASGMCVSPVAYVYASCIPLCSRLLQSKPLATLRQIRNTRYGWLVKPYEIPILGFLPSGTFTLKEATSFACRTNACFTGKRKMRSGSEAALFFPRGSTCYIAFHIGISLPSPKPNNQNSDCKTSYFWSASFKSFSWASTCSSL